MRALPLPARRERVGVRGRFHESEPLRTTSGAQTRGKAPHPIAETMRPLRARGAKYRAAIDTARDREVI
jgi:hypothetical protein